MHDVTQYPMVAHIVAELDDENDEPSDDWRALDRTSTPALAPVGRRTYNQRR